MGDFSYKCVIPDIDDRTIQQKTEDNIHEIEERLEHEEKKLDCIKKLKSLGFDVDVLKEVLK